MRAKAEERCVIDDGFNTTTNYRRNCYTPMASSFSRPNIPTNHTFAYLFLLSVMQYAPPVDTDGRPVG